jgi:hypothetical protein
MMFVGELKYYVLQKEKKRVILSIFLNSLPTQTVFLLYGTMCKKIKEKQNTKRNFK